MRSIIERLKIQVPEPLIERSSYVGYDYEAKIDAAIEERKQFLAAVIGAVDDGEQASPKDVSAMRTANDEIEDLGLRHLVRLPIHSVRKPGSSGSLSFNGKRFQSIGEAIVNGLNGGRGGGVEMYAAFDGTSGGTAAPSFFNPDLQAMPQRRRFLRELIPTVLVTSGEVKYVRQTVNTHAAAAVSAGGLKPTSTYTIVEESANVSVIAHICEAIDRSLLMDYDTAVTFLNDVLVIGVLLEEEDQLLNGDGIAPNLEGILNVTGIQTQAKGTDPHFDVVLKAMTKIRNSNFEPSAIVLNPADWQEIRLTRTADGEYIQGHPFEPGAEQLFGKPVLTSTLIAEGTGLVGAFDQGAIVYDREEARVTWAETGLGDAAGEELFSRNLVRARAESRIGLGVAHPTAFCSLTGI